MCRVFDSRQGYHFEHKNASACLGRDVFVFRYRYFFEGSFLLIRQERKKPDGFRSIANGLFAVSFLPLFVLGSSFIGERVVETKIPTRFKFLPAELFPFSVNLTVLSQLFS